MTRVAILTPTLTAADAVSNDVLAMQRVLGDRGHEVIIFAEHSSFLRDARQKPSAVHSYLRSPDDVLIYHHSIGWDRGIELLKTPSCRKIIKYHNVTPPEFFEGVSEKHQRLCEKGRSQLKDIVESEPDLYLAASAFNRRDLIAAGSEVHKTRVVPPFNHADKLQAGKASFKILDRYSDGTINLLTVGGVRPNKGHAALIQAFATYYHYFNSNARLFVVGSENNAFASYTASLRELINLWSIESRIVFTGEVFDYSLKAYYLVANALLITSEHEGFCVPLAEAMALKVPIIAYASTAIPETMEDSGLLWRKRDPYLMAQSIDFLLTNEAAKMALVDRGSQRYAENFSNRAIERQFLDATAAAGFEF